MLSQAVNLFQILWSTCS